MRKCISRAAVCSFLLLYVAEPATCLTLEWVFKSQDPGNAAGVISFSASSPDEAGKYLVKYIDASGNPVPGFWPVCELNADAGGTKAEWDKFNDLNFIPSGVAGIAAFRSDKQESSASFVLPENKRAVEDGSNPVLYSFGALSDIHLTTKDADHESRGYKKMIKTLKFFADAGASIVCICGDIANENKEEEFAVFKDICANAPGSLKIHACGGNHDALNGGFNDERWLKYTGHPGCYELKREDDVFLFIPMESRVQYRFNDLVWLDSKINEYRNSRIFIFSHHFIRPYIHDKGIVADKLAGEVYSFLHGILASNPNVMYFSGHSHGDYVMQELYPNANIYRDETSATSVHVSSHAYTRTGKNQDPFMHGEYEGYFVEVRKNSVVISGRDFARNEYIPMACYTITNRINSGSAISEETVLVDLVPNSTEPAGWNTLGIGNAKSAVTNAVDSNKEKTGVKIKIISPLGNERSYGSCYHFTRPQFGLANYPLGDAFPFRPAMCETGATATCRADAKGKPAVIEISGLSPEIRYGIRGFGTWGEKARTADLWTAAGAETNSAVLLSSGNIDGVADIPPVKPDSSGTILLSIQVDSSSSNKHSFASAFSITPQ